MRRESIITLALLAWLVSTAGAGDRVQCTTREDAQFQRLVTTCTDGSWAVSRYDEQFKAWRTDVVQPGKAAAEAEKGKGKR
jgi:hypothetical protein